MSSRFRRSGAVVALFAVCLMGSECYTGEGTRQEMEATASIQERMLRQQPVPQLEYSLARDVYIQIYNATNEARNTFTIVESMTGETKWACPSKGYGIPADVSLTNPLQGDYYQRGGVAVIEMMEPNGLYSSKNTDGTWILCVLEDGAIAPIYTEHKITTLPFMVTGVSGTWQRLPDSQPSTVIRLNR